MDLPVICRIYNKFVTALIVALSACSLNISAEETSVAELPPQIVVNSSVEIPADFNTTTIRAIFSGRMQRWPNGDKIQVFVLPSNHPTHLRFCRQILRTFPYVLQQQWDQITFTGTGAAPKEVATSYELLDKVKAEKGAIGYATTPPGQSDLIRVVGSQTQPGNTGD